MPSQEELNRLFSYDKITGIVTRKVSIRGCKYKKGSKVGCKNNIGYLVVRVNYKLLLVHRVVWMMLYSSEPSQIDHKNRNRSDNSLKNIKASNNMKNSKNTKLFSNNKSGVCGVSWYKARSLWAVSIQANGKPLFLGYFKDKCEAIKTRKEAELMYGYSENHGVTV